MQHEGAGKKVQIQPSAADALPSSATGLVRTKSAVLGRTSSGYRRLNSQASSNTSGHESWSGFLSGMRGTLGQGISRDTRRPGISEQSSRMSEVAVRSDCPCFQALQCTTILHSNRHVSWQGKVPYQDPCGNYAPSLSNLGANTVSPGCCSVVRRVSSFLFDCGNLAHFFHSIAFLTCLDSTVCKPR